MILIDIRDTDYGRVVDVRLSNALLPFSMPYTEYCELEKQGRLNDETAIDSNIRFMSEIRTMRTMPDGWIAEKSADHADWLDEKRTQEDARY